MDSNQIRETFLDFFRSKGHRIVPSAPMVVKNDPTLMFTNAGMNQFKDLFLGNSPIRDRRVADSQKCLRVSGKHNDLEEVGLDTYHHTMFEMLGNWSFGDYFKKEAISWAWELLVDVYGLPKERLYATIFEGSPEEGIERDDEAYGYWKRFLPEDHIILGNKHDNFWEMGDTGPCGPCSEIHYDLRSDEERRGLDGRELVNKGHHLVIEIWNLVFMQFNRKADGRLEPLPARHVDTGMGFERLCMVLQGKQSNYDTDVFQPTIGRLGEMCGRRYGDDPKTDVAMRVVADHLRAIAFSIADGQLPSNVKAGYVIRRILRRAVRYGYTYLGFDEPFICRLVDGLVAQMGGQFPELVAQRELIVKVIEEEENAFLRTLSTGISLLEGVMSKARSAGSDTIGGSDAFLLYDTYGFPIDLTELIASEGGMKVDTDAFAVELQRQKERSRNAAAVDTDDWVELLPIVESRFVGYDTLESDVRISRYRRVKAKNKTYFQLVFDHTPFYGNSGGQTGDKGYIEAGGERITVTDTLKENNLTIHLVDRLPADLAADFHAVVDAGARAATAANHTATHLLHKALRRVLGTHVEQKGSLVCPDYLRFDFSHFQKVTDEQIREVERLVNADIRSDYALEERRDCPIDEARSMGAMMLFGEKYGERVRVIRYGESVELCGGTHVARTGNIGFFKILSESATSAGVRRIEAVTAQRAAEFVYGLEDTLRGIQQYVNNPSVTQAIKKLVEENAELNKQIEEGKRERIRSIVESIEPTLTEEDGIVLIARQADFLPDIVKGIAFGLKPKFPNLVFVIGSARRQARVDGHARRRDRLPGRRCFESGARGGQGDKRRRRRTAFLCDGRRQGCRRNRESDLPGGRIDKDSIETIKTTRGACAGRVPKLKRQRLWQTKCY